MAKSVNLNRLCLTFMRLDMENLIANRGADFFFDEQMILTRLCLSFGLAFTFSSPSFLNRQPVYLSRSISF